MLADLASGNVDLEFALLADGVAKDKLYPLDIERGFKSLDRVRSAIRKFWDTGALSAQMLADKEVVLGSIWNGRLQAVADKGAPLAIEWNEASLQSQYWGVLKGARHAEDAQRFVDFACQPELQANLAKLIPYGPTNRQAFKSIPADVAAKVARVAGRQLTADGESSSGPPLGVACVCHQSSPRGAVLGASGLGLPRRIPGGAWLWTLERQTALALAHVCAK